MFAGFVVCIGVYDVIGPGFELDFVDRVTAAPGCELGLADFVNSGGVECFARTDRDLVALGIDVQHVERSRCGDTETAPLSAAVSTPATLAAAIAAAVSTTA